MLYNLSEIAEKQMRKLLEARGNPEENWARELPTRPSGETKSGRNWNEFSPNLLYCLTCVETYSKPSTTLRLRYTLRRSACTTEKTDKVQVFT